MNTDKAEKKSPDKSSIKQDGRHGNSMPSSYISHPFQNNESANHRAQNDYNSIVGESSLLHNQQTYQLMADNFARAATEVQIKPVQRAKESSELSSGFYLTNDNQQTESLQMPVNRFLAALRIQIIDMANKELAVIDQTAESCPYIDYWFEHYSEMGAEEVERAIQLFAPQTTGITSADEVIKLVVERAQSSLKQHVASKGLDPVDSENPEKLTQQGTEVELIQKKAANQLTRDTQKAINYPHLHSGNLLQLKSSSSGVAQLGAKKASKTGAVKIVRPGFVGSVKVMRKDAKSLHPTENIHMAHRLSWESIRNTIMTNDKVKIETMVNNLSIPQRNFGDPQNGGVKKGNKDYYNAIVAFHKAHPKDLEGLAKFLNSSPYNLRPGDGQTNSSIGGDPDAHFDETLPNEPMTPQSRALLPHTTVDSSDFMTMSDFADWEANFYDEYVVPAIKSVERAT